MTTETALAEIMRIVYEPCAAYDQKVRDEHYRSKIRAVLEKMDAWQPIETAPKDETTVDLWVVGTPFPDKPEKKLGIRIPDCWFCPEEKEWIRTGTFDEIEIIKAEGIEITHFLIPSPPVEGV